MRVFLLVPVGDVFHYENREENPAQRASQAAKEMGLRTAILKEP